MGWGQNPADVRAAEEARAAAIEAAENRPMSPFERKLIGVLEDIRDAVQDCRPVPLEPIVGVASSTGNGLDPLLDTPPAVLARAIAAGGAALSDSFPAFREDLTAAGFEKFAEVAIEAALHEAARDRSEETINPGRLHRVDVDLAFEPVSSRTIAEQAWRGPGLYELASTAASTQVYATNLVEFAEMIAKHPVLPSPSWRVGGPPDPSTVEQQPADELAGGEAVPPAAPPASAP